LIKKILSLLLCVAMVVTMLPMITTMVHAEDSAYRCGIVEKYYYPQNGSNPDTIPFSDFKAGFGDWYNNYDSSETTNFTAMFVLFKVDIALPAYTKVKVNCSPRAYASSMIFNIAGDFGLELFCFENDGEWENLVFNTGTSDDRSSYTSLAKQARNTFTDTEIALNPSQHYKEFDNPTGQATIGSFYYGILGYFRETGLNHQLGLSWNFESIAPYVDAKYIHYDANGGSGSAQTVIAGEHEQVTLHSGEGFTKENSAFVGWAYDGTSYAPGGVYSSKEGAKLRAQYLTFDMNGGTGTVTPGVRVENGVVFANGEGFTKENAAFLGWGNSAGGGSTYAPGEIYSETSSAKFYAQYLTYDLSNCSGTVTPGTRDEDGIAIASGDELYKTGHTFIGWNTNPNSKDASYMPGDVYSSRAGLTLYPIFEPNKYDVTVIADNCTVNVSQIAIYGTKVEMLAEPSIGYRVDGFEVHKTDDPTVTVPLTGANTFIQPEYPVTVKPVLSKIPYAVEKLPSENGSFTVSHETACIGDTVTVTATSVEGFELDSITVSRLDNGEFLAVTDGRFTMVPAPVRVSVSFKNRLYDITAVPTEHGSFTLEPDRSIMGDTVVVDAVPEEG